MKCWNCQKSNKNKGYNYEYCSKCGLYIDDLHLKDLALIVETLEKMIERWGLTKSISFYKRRDDDGYIFKYKGIKAIINHVFRDDDITIAELNALIKSMSYLSREFEMNITELTINFFWFAKDFFNSHQEHLLFWVKQGLKERNRYAYECFGVPINKKKAKEIWLKARKEIESFHYRIEIHDYSVFNMEL